MKVKISEVANLPSRFGDFKIQVFEYKKKEHLVIFKEPFEEIPLVRIHSECLTGDAIGSLKCDCKDQLEESLIMINKNGGMVLYLRQEGRDIGLLNKVNAYSLQDLGFDTIEANHQLGFKADERTYEIVHFVLEYFKVKKIRLLTNNPKKLLDFSDIVFKRVPLIMKENPWNANYLKTKKEKMGHLFE